MTPSILFFGSFQHYSTLILQALHQSRAVNIIGVVTTPPRPAGRKKILTPTHTHDWAQKNGIPVFAPETLDTQYRILHTLKNPPDFFVVAGYGKLLPTSWLAFPKVAAINVHFSLLPKYRGANPAEWAILLGETETGTTLIQMAEEFDTGAILSQEKITIEPEDTRETLYEKLYALGAKLAVDFFSDPTENLKLKIENLSHRQPIKSPTPPAYRFTRAHGFIDWQLIEASIQGNQLNEITPHLSTHLKTAWNFLHSSPPYSILHTPYAEFIARAVRALSGFPGVWTYVPTTKGKQRLKILSSHVSNNRLVLNRVQLEGKEPTNFAHLKNLIQSV